MDGYSNFRKRFGTGVPYKDWHFDDAARLENRIPSIMQRIVVEDGWCSYANGLIWLCDPDDWEIVAGIYSDYVPDAVVIARTAFGDLFLWDKNIFWFLMVHEALVMWAIDDVDWFFSEILPKDEFLPGPFKEAHERLGPLKWDEMYTYVPALALGGSGEVSTLEKVKAKEAIAILAQLQPLERA